MSDKELLELAAKAAGIDLAETYTDEWRPGIKDWWNPLHDDGDALRLATELGLNVFHTSGACYAMPSDDDGELEQKVSYRDAGGKHQATRQAIVRCAAEMAKA